MAFLILGILLIAPARALMDVHASVGIDTRIIAGFAAGCSLLTFFAYRYDKRQAETTGWRVPETTLQGLALIGGWPGAFLAQRIFRHKTAKVSFQFTYWLIVVLYQYVAIDSLLGWRFTQVAGKSLGL